MTIFLFVSLAVMLAASVPIFVALCGSVAATFVIFNDLDLVIILQRMFAGINKFSLMSIPLFVLAANLMGEGGISKRIINLANAFVGHIPGGLAITTIVASLFFGAISGSSPATVVAIGTLLYPALLEKGYSPGFAAGVITAAGSLGIIIPPSVNMIVYGTVTGASVGALFMAGFGAGVIYALMFIVYTLYYANRHPEIVREKKTSWGERLTAIRESVWGMGVPVIILGGIYGGIFTPTEAAAVAAVYSMVVSLFVYRELDLQGFINCVLKAAITTIQVMILLAATSVFAWILTSEGITVAIADAVLSVSDQKVVLLLLMNIVLLIAGMFLDGASITTILGPLFLPIATAAGVDTVHLGIIMVVNAAIGMFTPPFGLNLFVAAGITKQPMLKVAKGCIPFIAMSLIALLVVTYVPEVSLWLPHQIYGTW
ncbi:MAG: TRAP transporter large permease [Clostridiales bacterium]|nr:TRAP transporter large permease [Clostridiales bacterium]